MQHNKPQRRLEMADESEGRPFETSLQPETCPVPESLPNDMGSVDRLSSADIGASLTESSSTDHLSGDMIQDGEKDPVVLLNTNGARRDREENGKYEDPMAMLSPTTVTASYVTSSDTFRCDENSETLQTEETEEKTVSHVITDTQTLDRRTQSASALHNLSNGLTIVKSDDDDVQENGNEVDDGEDDEDAEDCVVTETLYHLHSKNRNNSNNYARPILTQAAEAPPPSPRHTKTTITPRSSPKPTLTKRNVSRNSPRTTPHSSPAPPMLDTSAATMSMEEKSLLDYAGYLMGFDQGTEVKTGSDALEDAWSVATKRRGVYNLIQVPLKLERLLMFVLFICADEFISTFSFLPLRAVLALAKFLSLPLRCFLRTSKPSGAESARRTKARIGNVIDVLHFSILVFTGTFLSLFDISWVYHQIRGQSVIKLYVVFNVMEIFDRLCSSFGVDLLDSLGWTTASAVSFLSRPTPTPQSGGATRARALQSLWLLSRVAFDYVFALVYTSIHATLLLVWVVTLNVAINTKNNALITLLIANNFVELKGSVFKSYKIQNMFQIACSDGVERFQLAVFLGIMLVYPTGRNALLLTWMTIFSCEVVVDWVKHAFAIKFNRIPHRVYSQFSMVICQDIAQARTHSVVRSVGGSAVAKRIGFVSLPLAALTARMATKTVCRTPPLALAILFLTLVFAKVALSIGLVGHAQKRLARAEEQHREIAGEEDEMEAKWNQSLANLARYDLIAKGS